MHMANRQTFVVGALGVLVGMVVGVSSAYNAQTVAFQGYDPNVASDMEDYRDFGFQLRERSDTGTRWVPIDAEDYLEIMARVQARAEERMRSAAGELQANPRSLRRDLGEISY